MKTGIELIAEERREQIEKHGWSKDHDQFEHSEGQIILAAEYALNPLQDNELIQYGYGGWENFEESIRGKQNIIERLKVAGALIAAEIDRIQRIKK